MANTIYTPVTLDVGGKNNLKVWAKQYDSNDRWITATIVNGDALVRVDPDSVVTINARREDDAQNSFVGEVNTDGTVNLPITYWMTFVAGTVSCDVSFYLDGRLSSLTFKLKVEEAATDPSEVIPVEDRDIVTALINDCQDATSEAETATESANIAAQAAREAAGDAYAKSVIAQAAAENANNSAAAANTATTQATAAASRAEAAAEQLDIDLTEIRSDIADNTRDIGTLTNRIDNLSSADVTYGSGTVGDELDKLEDDGTALANRVSSAEGNISSLGGRMTSAEGDITSLSQNKQDVISDLETIRSGAADGTTAKNSLPGILAQLGSKENISNRVETVDSSSDDSHYPTAKAVYDAIQEGGGTVDAYTKAETDALLEDTKEDIIYCGLEPGGDEVTLSQGGVDGNLAKWTMGTNDYHLLFDRTHVTNVYIENESDGAQIRCLFLNEYPNVVAGQPVNGKIDGLKVNAGASFTFAARGTWSTTTYLWIQYSYTGQTYKYKLLTVTLDNNKTLTLYSNGTLDLDVLKNPTIYDKIDELQDVTSEHRIENPTVARYMDEIDYSDDSGYTATIMSARNNGYTASPLDNITFPYKTCRPRAYSISWDAVSGASKYAVVVGDRTYYTTSTSIDIYNLIPGKQYKWTVYSMSSGSYKRNAIKSGTTNVIGQVRMINASDVYNMRDIGGWHTRWGKTIKYGKIFRGACLDKDGANPRSEADASGLAEMKALGMNVEIDFRTEGGLNYNIPVLLDERIALPLNAYETGLEERPERYVAVIKKIIECLAENKGIYLHCVQGADRTGTICMLLEAMLGVSDLDCSIDYELTAFNTYQNLQASQTANCRAENYAHEKPYQTMMAWWETNYPSATYPTLTDKVTAWYLAQPGTSMDDIYALRKAMLDGGCEDIDTSDFCEMFKVNFTAVFDSQTATVDVSCDKGRPEILSAISNGDLLRFSLDGTGVGMYGNYTTCNYSFDTVSGNLYVSILVGNTNWELIMDANGAMSIQSYVFQV